MTRLAPILIVLLAAAHVAAGQSAAVSADEYSVYSALINARFIKSKTDFAIIQAQTGLHLGGGGAKEFEDLLWTQNKKSYFLERRFDIRVKYELLDDRQFEQMFGRDLEALDKGWNRYWTQHPHSTGLLTLSRVAFNPDTGEAVLFASEVCGGLCGYGYLFRLKKDQGTWKIVEERSYGSRDAANKSLDRSGGGVFRIRLGAAKIALIRAARSTQTFGAFY